MKKLLLSVLLLLSNYWSFAYCVPTPPDRSCIRYDAVTGKITVEFHLDVPVGSGRVLCDDFYRRHKYYDYATGEYVKSKTYLYIQDPVTGSFLGAFPLTYEKERYCPGYPNPLISVFCGYSFYYDVSIPGFSSQQCYNMYLISDVEINWDNQYEPEFVPYPGLNPASPPSRIQTVGPMEVCVCPELPEDVCNAAFGLTVSTTSPSPSSIIPAPKFIASIYLSEYHPLSSYSIDWGDGTTGNSPGSHIYNPNPFASGNYTVCVTETTPDGHFCTYCVSFCAPVSYTGPSGSGMRRTGTSDIDSKLNNSIALYPNPTNGIAQLKFELPKSQQVKVTIEDLSGKQISILSSGIMEAGSHSVDLHTENFSSGFYQVKLEIENEIVVKKLSVIK